jgi:hypothetical protein
MSKQRDRSARKRPGKTYRRIPINEHVSQASPDEVLRAMARLPSDLDWSAVAANVVPILPRRRSLPTETGAPLTLLLPPGIPVGFGVDIGPAVLHVGTDLVRTWGVEPAEVAMTALQNLGRKTAATRPRDLIDDRIDGVPVRVLQSGRGWASTLLLLPDELMRIFGGTDQAFVAPMRDLLVSMPGDTDPSFLGWLREELVCLDPNALAIEAFTLTSGQLAYRALDRLARLA